MKDFILHIKLEDWENSITGCTASEISFIPAIIRNRMYLTGFYDSTGDNIKVMCEMLDISKVTYYTSLKSLIRRKILVKVPNTKNRYLVNKEVINISYE